MTTTRFRTGLTAGLLGLALLAGCSRSEPEQPAPTEVEETPEAAPVPERVEMTPPPAPTAAVVTPPPPAAEIAPDEQMQDDADATGMTARVTRDDAPAAEAPATDIAMNETEAR